MRRISPHSRYTRIPLRVDRAARRAGNTSRETWCLCATRGWPSTRCPGALHCLTTVLAIANNKGGVAKTTSALNLGVALSKLGKRVLLVDLDGQASLSLALPLPDPRRRPPRHSPPPPRTRHITEYFAGNATLRDLVQPTRFPLLWLLPAHAELYARDTGGAAHPEDELAFVRAIHDPALSAPALLNDTAAGGFDWIILDTPPARSGWAIPVPR